MNLAKMPDQRFLIRLVLVAVENRLDHVVKAMNPAHVVLEKWPENAVMHQKWTMRMKSNISLITTQKIPMKNVTEFLLI
jgi:hypothetical protein